jgi:hypothetical protein
MCLILPKPVVPAVESNAQITSRVWGSVRAISAPGNSSGISDRIRSRFFNVRHGDPEAIFKGLIRRPVKNRKESHTVSTEVTV